MRLPASLQGKGGRNERQVCHQEARTHALSVRLLDETGEVVFKGSVNTTKAAVERQLKLIAEFGDDLPNHFQAVEGRIGNTWVIRGEEHSAREGEQGRVGDAIPLGFGVLVGDKEEVLATKDRIVAAAKGATVEDQTGE